MAADDWGSKGEPEFLGAGAPDTAVDPTLVAKYAALVGNLIVNTSANRIAFDAGTWAGFAGLTPWFGLQWRDTDGDKRLWTYDGAWKTVPIVWGTIVSANANVDGLITVNHGLGLIPDWVQATTYNTANDTLDRITVATVRDDLRTATQVRLRMRREDTNNWFPSDFFRVHVTVGKN